MLKPWMRGQYLALHLGSKYTESIHSLVALTFIGPRPKGFEVGHKDGNRFNNSVSNLEYITPKQNSEIKNSHSTMIRGEKHPKTKLTSQQILEIRNLRGKMHQRLIAAKFGIGQDAVSKIQLRKRWNHV